MFWPTVMIPRKTQNGFWHRLRRGRRVRLPAQTAALIVLFLVVIAKKAAVPAWFSGFSPNSPFFPGLTAATDASQFSSVLPHRRISEICALFKGRCFNWRQLQTAVVTWRTDTPFGQENPASCFWNGIVGIPEQLVPQREDFEGIPSSLLSQQMMLHKRMKRTKY